MPNVLIAGGGFAAVWTAAAAARRRDEAGLGSDELAITLVAPNDQMVVRPRLYEARPAQMQVPLARVLDPIGVEHVRGVVNEVDGANGRVSAVVGDEVPAWHRFDRLVLATGSSLVRRNDLPGAEWFHDVDTLPAAVALDEHLVHVHGAGAGRYTVVVVGGGFVGIEVATEMVDRLTSLATVNGAAAEVRVVVLERADRIGPELGPGPRPAIEAALSGLGVEVRLETTIVGYEDGVVHLDSGESIAAATVIWTAGMRASWLTGQLDAPRDDLGRLLVDRRLRVPGHPHVFAAGDTAAVEVQPGVIGPQSCQYAHQHGKHAGHNAVADLLGEALLDFRGDPYVTCVDLGAAGAVYTEGFDRVERARGEAAKAIKRVVNQELIYPPLDSRDAILRAADHLAESRPPSAA